MEGYQVGDVCMDDRIILKQHEETMREGDCGLQLFFSG
jgi:hypothetical protein